MLNIWTNTPLPDSSLSLLRAGVGPNRLLVSTQLTNILKAAGPDPLLADADIAFGQPDPDQLLGLTRLKWVHLSTAGYTRYDRPDLRQSLTDRKILVTNSSSVFDEPCAEHALAFMLAAARDFPAALANQLGPHNWPQDNIRMNSRLLTGQSVLILGFGAIARRLVELLSPFRMNIRAVRRAPRHDEPIPVHPMTDVDKLLPAADHVVNILPADRIDQPLYERPTIRPDETRFIFLQHRPRLNRRSAGPDRIADERTSRRRLPRRDRPRAASPQPPALDHP